MKVIDKIRSMSEEDLAEVIYDMDVFSTEVFGGRIERFCESKCRKNEEGDIECGSKGGCKDCIKEWFNTEYED
jgi:hypothetical protein